MSRYEIVAAPSLIELCHKINRKIDKGFIPVGNVMIDKDSKIARCIQAVYCPRECRRVYMYKDKEVTFDEYIRLTIKDVLDAESKA